MGKCKQKSVKFLSEPLYVEPSPPPEMVIVPNREGFTEFAKQESVKDLMDIEGVQVSYQNFRSPNSVTILALGLSGDGTTYTLEHLMGRQGLSGVGIQTETIHEYTYDWPSGSLGIENSKIIFIDTPGLGHPDSSSEFDLQSLKNIAKYFELKKYHPNFVLLIGSLSQPCIERRKGRFIRLVKMVKETLEDTVVDLINTNFMLVLTHLAERIPSVQRDPSEIVKQVGEAVAYALKIENRPPVVVVAENQVGVFTRNGVEGFFMLPNRQLYPKNIYEGMIAVAGNHDPVGCSIVREICGSFPFLKALEARRKIFAFPGLSLGIFPPVPHAYFFERIPERKDWLAYAKTKPLSMSQLQIHHSFSARRDVSSTTVLLIGEAGAGKSSTINSMLGRRVAPVYENREEGTEDIVEYTVEVLSRSLLMANSKIHIVDTPGLGHESKPLGHDAKVYANIRQYFERRGVFPNAILLVANITHPLTSPVHPFPKLLRAIRAELLDVVLDNERPNLLVVLTHLCSLPQNTQQDPTDLVMSVKKLVTDTLSIPDVPIEVAENWSQDLQTRSSNQYLPTKQRFPRNLIVRIAFSCLAGADPVGQQIMNDGFPILPEKEIQTNVFPLEDFTGFSEVAQSLIEGRRTGLSEVERALRTMWMLRPLEEKIECGRHIDEICSILSEAGFENFYQLTDSKRDLIKLYKALDPDPGTECFITRALGIEVPRFDFDTMLGKGYDLLRDSPKDFPILLLGEPRIQEGVYLPKHVISSLCPERKLIWRHSHSKGYLVRRRLSQLNIEFHQRVHRPDYKFRPGFNLIHDYGTLTAVYDFHWMKLDLDGDCPLNPDFEALVRELPKSYSKCSMGQWQDFINQVGVHYVSRSYIGGSIVFEIKNLNPDAVRRMDRESYNADAFLNYVLGLPKVLPPNREDSNLNLIFMGGDPIRGEELRGSENRVEFFSRLKRWENAIWENPIVSDMGIGLSEVADLVTKIDARAGRAMKAASKDLKCMQQDSAGCSGCPID